MEKRLHLLAAALLIGSAVFAAFASGDSAPALRISGPNGNPLELKNAPNQFLMTTSNQVTGDVFLRNTDVDEPQMGKNLISIKEDSTTTVTITPPYYSDLSTEAKRQGYSIIDANSDGKTWGVTTTGQVLYTYGSKKADDWLVTPGVELKAGMKYRFKAELKPAYASYPETFEIKMGKVINADSFNIVLSEECTITEAKTVDVWIQPDSDGIYYIGFHALSEARRYYLYLDYLSISDGICDASPDSVTDLSLKAAPLGALSANVSFRLPTKNVAGNAVGTLTKVEVKNETADKVVATIDNPSGTDLFTVTDTAAVNGINNYAVTCYTADATGLTANVSGWVGIDVPDAVQNAKWVIDGNKVTVTWDRPSNVGTHGGYVDPSAVTFNIYNSIYSQYVASNWTSTSYEVSSIKTSNQQDILYFAIVSCNSAGSEVMGITQQAPYGTPYDTPYTESYPNRAATTKPWMSTYSAYGSWKYSSATTTGVTPYDNDGGMYALTLIGEHSAAFMSPMVNVASLDKPMFTFASVGASKSTPIVVSVSHDSGNTFTQVAQIEDDATDAWTVHKVDLSSCKDWDYAIFKITANSSVADTTILAFDKFKVCENAQYELVAKSFTGDKKVVAGKTAKASLTIANEGQSATSDYTIVVKNGDETVASAEGVAIEPDSVLVYDFDIPTTITTKELNLTANISFAADEKQSNNTAELSIAVEAPVYPAPTLRGEGADSGVKLTWNNPSGEVKPADYEYTEGAEDFESWSIGGISETVDASGNVTGPDTGYIGDFKVIDGDHQTTSYLYLSSKYANRGARMAAQVFDTRNPDNWTGSHEAHSGQKMFVFWSASKVANDDYLIFPKLGKDKTISFWGNTMSASYGKEKFEIVTSSTGTNKEDFYVFATGEVAYGKASASDYGYTKFEYTLPDSAQYVAIHYVSKKVFGLMIDDITMTRDGGDLVTYTAEGYNVYRNGTKINTELVTDTTYIDNTFANSENTYNVTAVYSEGESVYSNDFVYEVTGVDEITSAQGVINGGYQSITLKGFADKSVDIYTVDGRQVATAKANNETTIPVASGIYVVKAGNIVKKVVVK